MVINKHIIFALLLSLGSAACAMEKSSPKKGPFSGLLTFFSPDKRKVKREIKRASERDVHVQEMLNDSQSSFEYKKSGTNSGLFDYDTATRRSLERMRKNLSDERYSVEMQRRVGTGSYANSFNEYSVKKPEHVNQYNGIKNKGD